MASGFVTGTLRSIVGIRQMCSYGTVCAFSLALWVALAVSCGVQASDADRQTDVTQAATRCVVLELYTRSGDQKVSATAAAILKAVMELPGVRLKVYDLDKQPQFAERLRKIAEAYKLAPVELPLVYGLNHTEN